jgi:hypothetical protein
VKQKSETITVALHPEDLKALTAYESGPLGWKYVADEALLSGDIRISLDTIDIADILMASPQKRPQSAQPQLDSGTASDADLALDVGDVGRTDTSGEDE